MSIPPPSRAARLLTDTSDSLKSLGTGLCAAGSASPSLTLMGGTALGLSTAAQVSARQFDFERTLALETASREEDVRDRAVRRSVATEDQRLRGRTLEVEADLEKLRICADVAKAYSADRRDVEVARIEAAVHLARAASAERIEADRSRERVHTSPWQALFGCCSRRSFPRSFSPSSEALTPLRGLTLDALLAEGDLSEEQKAIVSEQFDLIAAHAPSEMNTFITGALASLSRKEADGVWKDLFAKYSTITRE